MEPTQGGVVNENGLDAVVKVFAATMSPNYSFPWQMKPQILQRTGSGFVISGRKILTNAHVVTGQISLSVRKRGAPIKYKAEVQAVGHECDLALLMVSDPKFWEGMNFLEFGDIPCLGARVTVVGYPCGGDNISVTSGVVSRVELSQYAHGAANLIAIQVDAAINVGNSGGPAIVNEKVVGVAFQTLPTATNIGYIIPVLVIEHFLADVIEHGKYIGFCTLGVSYEPTENKQLRDYLKMPPELTGVRVSKINPLCDSHNMLKKDDVIIAFDDIPVASDGTATFREGERIMFDHFVSIKKAGETGAVRVLRDGVKHEFQIKLGPSKPLVPICEFDKSPSYFIFGGLVFTPLTVHYIRECGDNWNSILPHRLCQRALTEFPQKNGEQIIILSQVLIDDISTGYQHLSGFQVKKVNEVVVDNLKHLHQLVECCREENLRFDLDDGRVIVLNFKNARDAAFRILKQHGISSAMSPDLEKDPMQDKLECEDEDEDAAFPILKQHGISSAMSPDLEKNPMQEKLKCEDEDECEDDEDECEDEEDEDEYEDDEVEDAAFPILKQHGISSAVSPDLEKDPMQEKLKCEDEDEDECEDDEDEQRAEILKNLFKPSLFCR